MIRTGVLTLEFSPECSDLGKGKALRDGLSVAVLIGDTLWVTNDETISLERLALVPGPEPGICARAGGHVQFPLADYLDLPVPSLPGSKNVEEADLEGLAYGDGYLWLVGSHSLKRKKPRLKSGPDYARERLATVKKDPNRYLLARIPVVERGGLPCLEKSDGQSGRRAARLRGDGEGSDLTAALAEDEHLAPFLAIPGKDNGFDVEGLAVAGKRLFLGLRGPVLRGWAVILEVEPREEEGDSPVLRLAGIGPGGRPYRKHFLHLDSLGIRDLCIQGDDLLVLAGPTMDLDGPVAVFRWPGGARPEEEMVVPAGQLERVLDVPYGQGVDHAEGMALFCPEEGESDSILVVYDAAAPERQRGGCSVTADIFSLAAGEKAASRASGRTGREK